MPVKLANSSQELPTYDFACLRRRFRTSSGASYTWRVALKNATSDDINEASDEDYWGTPDDWRVLNADALSDDEFDDVAEYLRASGQAAS